ncbi:TRNA-dihydrouridine(47) synthase [NAD(P)(+)] [Aphelenchoides bicaudatus]|nr:TRNA-dihydrouridine(47) synthase [NAD(P)(+)] [Aphelenchoides bicaudatus]
MAEVVKEVEKMETNVVDEPRRTFTVGIKAEYLLQVEANNDEDQKQVENKNEEKPQNDKKFKKHGIDKQRKRKMNQARAEVNRNEVRLCPSVVTSSRKCKYGENCRFEHSIDAYMKTKQPDLGDKCVNFDSIGTCPYGVSCRFGSIHTNEDFSQISKDPDPSYKPTINTHYNALQISIRKREYDFAVADEACKKFANPNIPSGAMNREKVKLDMRSLKGKTYLAPLTTVGNLPFRRLCVELGAEITCGEMAIATNFLRPNGGANEWPLLKRHHTEKIFGVQLAGGYPDTLSKTAQIIRENVDVDFVDLNLGCPIDMINDKGGGCCLGNRPNKLFPVVKTMQEALGDIPLTLKMRYGLKNNEYTAHAIMNQLTSSCPPQLITLHPRSKEQRYTKEAHWNYVPQCIEALNKKVPLWVCGDVYNQSDYYKRLEEYDIDGIMIGRAALIKPWLFTEIKERRDWDISASERLGLIQKFVNYGLEHWGSDNSGVETTRRFLLEWMSFQYRYVPLGILERPQRMNEKPMPYFGRSDMETMLSSRRASDWIQVSEMFLGKTPDGFLFVPKHNANAW